MTDNTNKSNGEKINEIVDRLFKCNIPRTTMNLDKFVENEPERKYILTSIFKSIILSENRTEIKEYLKELAKSLEEFRMPFHDEKDYKNKSKPKAPIFWSNQGDKTKSKEYNLKAYHYYCGNNKPIIILLDIIKEAIMRTGELNIADTYCQELFKECDGEVIIENGKVKEVLLKKHVPYDKFFCEIWAEEIPLEDILNGELRIEFGQSDPIKRNKDKVYFATDSVMSMSELPILLDRIAKYNIEMELAGTPEKKIYLENVGISIDEVISGNYKTISERYGEGKDNENAGYVILKKIERSGPHGDASKESIMVPIKLKLMILKLEEQRLTEIEEELDSLKEKIVKEWIMTNGKISRMLMEKNSSLKNSFVSEEQQNIFYRGDKKRAGDSLFER